MGAMRFLWISMALLWLTTGALAEDDLVPILAWSNRDTFSSVSVGERNNIGSLVQQSSFSQLGFVFVFSTEKMTFDDIVKYGSVYGDNPSALENIQSEMANSVSSVWAGAEGSVALQLVNEIAYKLDMSPNFISGMEDVAVIFGQPQLLVVELPYGDCEEEFAQQDAMISEILDAVHYLDTSYAAFYTAMTTKQDMDSAAYGPLLAKRGAPSLKTSSEYCAVSYGVQDDTGSYCALLCMTNETILFWESEADLQGGKSPCVAKITAFNEGGTSGCESSTIGLFPSIFATIEGTCDDSGDEMQAEVEFAFPQGNFQQSGQRSLQAGSWQMMIISGSFNLSRYDSDGKLVYPFSVPIGASYACQTDSTVTSAGFSNPNRFLQIGNVTDEEAVKALTNGEGSPVIQFTGIHIQAYGYTYSNGEPVFGTVYDCHGFFTLTSLMGVFTVAILVLILYLSLVFAFSVETMDRFADPREPSITVENLR